ncbi:MAG TPA: helix-turn-helix domain-containing protein [Solirubrobacterales bacterium]|nr:helix-turn-helix domain-containing protein [Solirubrobacterales bacterium]
MPPRDRHEQERALLAALRHPLRRQILRVMEVEEPISPSQLSNRLEHPLSNVSYHVRVLADCEAVALVSTEPIHGSVQHFYRASVEVPWAREILAIDEGDGETPGETPAH